MHAQLSREARCLNFDMTLNVYPFFLRTSMEGSEETTHMCSPVRVFAGHTCNKYQIPQTDTILEITDLISISDIVKAN